MKTNVVMPKMGESITDGTILAWHKSVGESISKDEPLLDIGTDKVDSEIPSPASGKILEIKFNINDTVPVGEVIAIISDSDDTDEDNSDFELNKKIKEEEIKIEETKIEKPPVNIKKQNPNTDKFFTPLVKSIATKEGISLDELSSINGSGSNGRITKNDILSYLEQKNNFKVKQNSHSEDADRVRLTIADRMIQSQKTSAHVYTVAEADVTNLVKIREHNNKSFIENHDIKITYTPMIIHACKKALKEFPLINSSFDGKKITYHKNVDIGVAVALETNNLVVPVIKNAEEINFLGLSRKSSRLAIDARSGNLQADDLSGSTFTITNPGMFGGLFGMGIINQPNVAILTVGSFQKRPIVKETEHGDSIIIRNMSYLTLGYDHRIIDGVYGTKFLMRVIELIEDMDESILEI